VEDVRLWFSGCDFGWEIVVDPLIQLDQILFILLILKSGALHLETVGVAIVNVLERLLRSVLEKFGNVVQVRHFFFMLG
jgi:hypothetical protein